MSRRKQKIVLEKFKIDNHVLKPGQQVLLKPPTKGAQKYVALIEEIVKETTANGKDQVQLRCRWYYRPEESIGGRRSFHGLKEVFLSDHVDHCWAESVESECRVHTLRTYTSLRTITPTDFFCRFEYNAQTGLLSPDKVAVYCTCEMPFNPDLHMLFCKDCQDLFHPKCVGMNEKSASKRSQVTASVEKFTCPTCFKSKEKAVPKAEKSGISQGESKVESTGESETRGDSKVSTKEKASGRKRSARDSEAA